MTIKTITFKGELSLNQALINIAAQKTGGNKSQAIINSLNSDPAIAAELKKILRKKIV